MDSALQYRYSVFEGGPSVDLIRWTIYSRCAWELMPTLVWLIQYFRLDREAFDHAGC